MSSLCSITVPGYTSADCQVNPLDGGIDKIVIAADDIETTITDITDATQWQTALDAGDLEIWDRLLAEIPEATAKELQLESCATPQVVNFTRTINIQDLNTGTDNTTFMNSLNANASGFYIGYVDCNGNFYGWITKASAKMSRLHEQTKQDGVVKWQGTISWIELDEFTPSVFPSGLSY